MLAHEILPWMWLLNTPHPGSRLSVVNNVLVHHN